MDQIRDWLYIGKYLDTTALAGLQAAGIGAMLQLAEYVVQPGIKALYLPVEDGEPLPHYLLERGMDFVREQCEREKTVLIACGAGISRSATFCIAALHEREGLPLVDAFAQVYRARRQILPHPALWHSLAAYYGDPMDFATAYSLTYTATRESM